MSKKSEQKSGGKNLRVMHTAVGVWPKGHVIGADELPDGTDVNRLLALGAVVETDDPATGGLDTSALPPGAAVTHQMTPGDELPPNALETAKAGAAGPTTGADAETFGHGDNQYPLAHFDGMSDEQILEVPGVGEATLKDIRKAQKKANRQ